MKITSVSMIAFAAGLSLASGSYAMNPRQACKQDAQTYCSDVKPGGGRILDCLEDHYKQLSDECYSALQAHEKRQSSGNNDGPQRDGDDGRPPPPRDGDDRQPPPPPPGGDDGQPPPPPSGDDGNK